MFGVDLGTRISSITLLNGKHLLDSLVIKERDPTEKYSMAMRIATEVLRMSDRHRQYPKTVSTVALEEPVMSWRRRNPKSYAKLVALYTIVEYCLTNNGLKVIPVNNRSAKKAAGCGGASGKNKKLLMIQAYKRATGNYPGSRTKYGQETLADSYWIARAARSI